MSEGWFGLIGAALGGVIGVLGALGAARIARQGQHHQWHREVRRDAYSSFIVKAGQAIRLAGHAAESIHEEWADAGERLDEYRAALEGVAEAAVLVTLEGPERIAVLAMNTHRHLDTVGTHLTNYTDHAHPEAFPGTYEASAAAQDQLREFTRECRRALAEPVQSA